MSTRLLLWDASLTRLHLLKCRGTLVPARKLIESLLGWPGLTPAQTLHLLGEVATVCRLSGLLRRERGFLRRAIVLNPRDGTLYFQLGRAFEDDPSGCDRKACRAYEKAVALNSDAPQFRANLGRAMVRINERLRGVRVLCEAAEAAPTDPDVLQVVLEGLREAGECELACTVLCKSRFQAPTCQRLLQLWQRAKYDLARQTQRSHAGTNRVRPFLRVISVEGEVKRRDTHSNPKPHFGSLRAFRTDRGQH